MGWSVLFCWYVVKRMFILRLVGIRVSSKYVLLMFIESLSFFFDCCDNF